MPASEARIQANRKNSLLSTGPKTEEGKAASCRNALKHGLACELIAPTAEEAAEVARRSKAMGAELGAEGEMQTALAGRIALLSVRLERCARQESASIAANVGRAVAEFDEDVASDPEAAQLDPASIARARSRVAALATFDPSREASLARRHEAAAERGMYRAIRELRALKAEARANQGGSEADRKAAELASTRAALASFRKASAAAVAPAPAPVASVAASPTPEVESTPSRPVPAAKPTHMNRRQRRAALARRA